MAEKMVINVSAQLAKSLLAEVAELEQEGGALALRRAQAIRVQAERLMVEQGIEDPDVDAELLVPFTARETAQAEKDATAAAIARAAADAAAAARAALVTKLTDGTATDLETQQALAKLLGGG